LKDIKTVLIKQSAKSFQGSRFVQFSELKPSKGTFPEEITSTVLAVLGALVKDMSINKEIKQAIDALKQIAPFAYCVCSAEVKEDFSIDPCIIS